MENSPVEIIEKIIVCPELSMKDVANVSLTCKKLYGIIAHNNTVWRKKFFQKWPHLQNKLNDRQILFYEELQHIYELRKRVRKMLEEMSNKFYRKVELSDTDLAEWDEILREKLENVWYLINDLMEIVHTKTRINSIHVVPLNTPGNLTQKYYAAKVLRYVRQQSLVEMWQKFASSPPERQLLEIGSAFVAQWGQPKIEIDPEKLYRKLDGIAETVKFVLKRDYPGHPLLQATKEQLQLWRAEIRPENQWSPADCRKIIAAISEVMFQHMGFTGYARRDVPFNAPDEGDTYLNVVLNTRKGMAISLAIIFDAIGRRLGLRCEPIIFPSHFLLRFSESRHPDADWYYIDVFNGGQILRKGICPFSKTDRTRTKFPGASGVEVIVRIASDLEHLARQAYSPSGRVTTLRSTLELIRLVNPRNISALINLARLYMLHNFDTRPLEDFLLTHDFDVPEQATNLVQMLRNYCPDPPERPTEPVRRPQGLKFAVGMIMYHLLYRYKCVIFNWDPICMAAEDWQWRNNVVSLTLKDRQPFYNVLVEDGSHRYVAEENLQPVFEPRPLQLNDEVGRHFSHFCQSHYVPNAQTENNFPEDKAVRCYYEELEV